MALFKPKTDKEKDKTIEKDGQLIPKKLKDFYDAKSPQTKKFKSLVSFCEGASSAGEVKTFFEKEAFTVWAVFLDSFQYYEQQQKISKKDDKEIEKLLLILKRFLIYLPAKIKEKWQCRSISNILEKILYVENKHEIRIQGLELLLIFLEDLETPDTAQTNILASAIDLEIFKGEYQRKITLPTKPPSATDKNAVLFPSSVPPKPDDSVGLIGSYLDYMGSNNKSFALLWKLFRTHYLTLLSTDVAKHLALLDRFSELGFPIHCPRDVIAIMISKIGPWSNIDSIMRTIWNDKENTAIMLELFRQASILPIKYVETTRQAIEVYRRLFFGSTKEIIPPAISEQKEKLISFQRFFVEQLPNVFKTMSTPQTSDQQAVLCLEILQLFRQTAESIQIDAEIRDVLLFTLLDITVNLLKADNPNTDLAKSLASHVVDVLLFTWISSRFTDVKKWTRLHEGLQSLFHRIEPVVQVKVKLVQLTYILRGFIFRLSRDRPNKQLNDVKEKNKHHSFSPDDRKRSKSESDSGMESIQWNYTTVRFIWDSLMQMFKGFSRIKEPAIFSQAVGAITEIIDIFLEAEQKSLHYQLTDLNYYTSENPIPPIHLLNTFGAGLFEACQRDDNYTEGKAKAFGAVCRLICRHYTPFPGHYSPEILPYFYNIIHFALCNPAQDTDLVSFAIIDCSSNIFNLGLPGASVLIPYYLVEINRIMRGHPAPIEVRRKAIILTCSVICYASQFGDLEIPTRYFGHFRGAEEKMKAVKFRDQIGSILVHGLRGDSDVEINCMSLWGICVLCFDNFFSSPDIGLVTDLIKIVLTYTTSQEWQIASSALDAIASFATISKEIAAVDKKFFVQIIEGLCNNILSELKEGKKEKELADKIISHHFFCLTDWVISVPSIMDTPELVKKIFGVIQTCMTSAVRTQESMAEKKKKKEKERSESTVTAPTLPDPNARVITPPSVKDAARFLLLHLLSWVHNFPTLQGVEFSASRVTETDDGGPEDVHVSHFVYKNAILLSCVETVADDGTKSARIFTRDMSGKYAWDCKFAPTNEGYIPESQSVVSLFAVDATPAPKVQRPKEEKKAGAKAPFTFYDEQQEAAGVDKIDEVLQYLGEKHPDCLPESQKSLNQPTMIPSKFLGQIVTVQKALANQQSEDNKLITEKLQNKQSPQSWAIQPPKTATISVPMQYCRLLLSHLGILDSDNVEDLQQIENNKMFQYKLRYLDSKENREIAKVGLVYVKEGQDEQHPILANEEGSPMYNEFVSGLAWPVPVKTHKGYLGGLDPNGSNGKDAPYFTSPTLEVVYHEVVKMPTSPSDITQLQKKRHVGNDSVHIIYSEHGRDYSPKTIVSQFNDAHIIIYPLENGMFRIQVAKKEKVNLFGPLVHGMCINKRLLPILTRLTAISAHRTIRYNQEGYERPFFLRTFLVQEIVSKFVKNQDYQSLLEAVFFYSDAYKQMDKNTATAEKTENATA